jgi:hypothetical protein
MKTDIYLSKVHTEWTPVYENPFGILNELQLKNLLLQNNFLLKEMKLLKKELEELKRQVNEHSRTDSSDR